VTDCSRYRDHINRYLDGELGYLEVAELQRHLDFCPDCAVELAQTGALRSALAAWGRREVPPPPGFSVAVMAAVALEPAPGTPRPLGRVVADALDRLDRVLGRLPLPGGRTVPVKNVLGAALAAAAVIFQLQRRHERRPREVGPL